MNVNLLKVKQKTAKEPLSANLELAAQYLLAIAALGCVLWFGWLHRLELAEIPTAWRETRTVADQATVSPVAKEHQKGAIYSWRDRSGVRNFSDKPPH